MMAIDKETRMAQSIEEKTLRIRKGSTEMNSKKAGRKFSGIDTCQGFYFRKGGRLDFCV